MESPEGGHHSNFKLTGGPKTRKTVTGSSLRYGTCLQNLPSLTCWSLETNDDFTAQNLGLASGDEADETDDRVIGFDENVRLQPSRTSLIRRILRVEKPMAEERLHKNPRN